MTVHSKNQASNFQASLLPCSGWIYDTNSESRHGAKASMDTGSILFIVFCDDYLSLLKKKKNYEKKRKVKY